MELIENKGRQYELLRTFSQDKERFPVYVLHTMALLRGESTHGRDLLRLDHQNFQTDWNNACTLIGNVLRRISLTRSGGYGVLAPHRVPYPTMIPVLASCLPPTNGRNDALLCYCLSHGGGRKPLFLFVCMFVC